MLLLPHSCIFKIKFYIGWKNSSFAFGSLLHSLLIVQAHAGAKVASSEISSSSDEFHVKPKPVLHQSDRPEAGRTQRAASIASSSRRSAASSHGESIIIKFNSCDHGINCTSHQYKRFLSLFRHDPQRTAADQAGSMAQAWLHVDDDARNAPWFKCLTPPEEVGCDCANAFMIFIIINLFHLEVKKQRLYFPHFLSMMCSG